MGAHLLARAQWGLSRELGLGTGWVQPLCSALFDGAGDCAAPSSMKSENQRPKRELAGESLPWRSWRWLLPPSCLPPSSTRGSEARAQACRGIPGSTQGDHHWGGESKSLAANSTARPVGLRAQPPPCSAAPHRLLPCLFFPLCSSSTGSVPPTHPSPTGGHSEGQGGEPRGDW